MSAATATLSQSERRLLDAARNGDEHAFVALVEPRHAELRAHCYRMLGSVHDAEDSLQEALLRAWRGLPRFQDRSSLRTWLYKISTNTCLDELAKRPKRVLPVDFGPGAEPGDPPGEPLAEAVWIGPYPDDPEASYEQREGVELAFVAALQHLAPNQRATLILREVLGFSAKEAADALDTTVASVNSALQRARVAVDERMPERSQQATLAALGDDEARQLVGAYMAALESGDIDAIIALLADEATWSMPPCPAWFRGAALRAFLEDHPGQERWRHVPARANGQLAVGCYMWDGARFRIGVLDVLTLEGAKIAAVTAFLAPWVYSRFGDIPGHMTPKEFARFGLPEVHPQ